MYNIFGLLHTFTDGWIILVLIFNPPFTLLLPLGQATTLLEFVTYALVIGSCGHLLIWCVDWFKLRIDLLVFDRFVDGLQAVTSYM